MMTGFRILLIIIMPVSWLGLFGRDNENKNFLRAFVWSGILLLLSFAIEAAFYKQIV